MVGFSDGDLVRYVPADAGERADSGEELGVGIVGRAASFGRLVDFFETVGPLWCSEDELVAVPEGWTPARAVTLLGCGVSAARVAELTGYDQGWLAAQERRIQRRCGKSAGT